MPSKKKDIELLEEESWEEESSEESFEKVNPMKLDAIRLYQIMFKHSDYEHQLTQAKIAEYLLDIYGVKMERKAVSRNIRALNTLQDENELIKKGKTGYYFAERTFTNGEIRMLIDSVLSCKHIPPAQTNDLINRLKGLSNDYFGDNILSVKKEDEWKNRQSNLFLNIPYIDKAITEKCSIKYDYNKYGIDGRLHKSSEHVVSPYQLIVHNQNYYLMGYNETYKSICYHRLDRITNVQQAKEGEYLDSRWVPGFKEGIKLEKIATTMPYMFSDEPKHIKLRVDESVVSDVIETFGKKTFTQSDIEGKYEVYVKSSPTAMVYWALQYINHVEVLSPKFVRNDIKKSLENGMKMYEKKTTE